mgnify:FL=1|jgi:large subunit ribosomal protein L24e
MVVKTEVCSFSELKIFPGKGLRYMSKDCKLPIFLSKKACKLYLRKVKPQKIRWCTAWRRINKKLQTGEVAKKKRKRARKVIREIVGMDIETISKKKNETKEERAALAEKAIRQIKERRAKVAKAAPKGKTAAAPTQKAAQKNTGKK